MKNKQLNIMTNALGKQYTVYVNGSVAKDEMSLPLWWWIITRFWRRLLNAWIIMGWKEPCALRITGPAGPTSLWSLGFSQPSCFPPDKSDDYFIGKQNWNNLIRDLPSSRLAFSGLSTSCALTWLTVCYSPSVADGPVRLAVFNFPFKKGGLQWFCHSETFNRRHPCVIDRLRSRQNWLAQTVF